MSGEPTRGATPFGEVRGMVDAHMHMMAFEFLGGRVHCGRPWHPYGVAGALVDCPDHEPAGAGAIGENVLCVRQPGRHARHARLADAQGLAAPRLAHARADLLPVARARRIAPGCG